MPPYDPKANRPKLVPVDDGPAPVDAILGGESAPAPTPDAPPAAESRPRLSVVESRGATPAPAPTLAAVPSPPEGSRPDQRVIVAVAVLAAVTVLAVVVVRRRG